MKVPELFAKKKKKKKKKFEHFRLKIIWESEASKLHSYLPSPKTHSTAQGSGWQKKKFTISSYSDVDAIIRSKRKKVKTVFKILPSALVSFLKWLASPTRLRKIWQCIDF